MHGAKKRKIQIGTLYAALGALVLAFLLWQQSFPSISLWLAFGAAFAFFDWRSVEVNDRMLMSPTVMVALTAAVAFGPGTAALGVASMAALGAFSADDVRQRRWFQPIANFGQLVVAAGVSVYVLEWFLKRAEEATGDAFWLWIAGGSAVAATVYGLINYTFVTVAVRAVFEKRDLRPWSNLGQLLPSYLLMGFVVLSEAALEAVDAGPAMSQLVQHQAREAERTARTRPTHVSRLAQQEQWLAVRSRPPRSPPQVPDRSIEQHRVVESLGLAPHQPSLGRYGQGDAVQALLGPSCQ